MGRDRLAGSVGVVRAKRNAHVLPVLQPDSRAGQTAWHSFRGGYAHARQVVDVLIEMFEYFRLTGLP